MATDGEALHSVFFAAGGEGVGKMMNSARFLFFFKF